MRPDDIRSLKVTQIRIFPADTLPVAAVASPNGVESLKASYGLERSPFLVPGLPAAMVQTGLVFENGQYETDGRILPVAKVQIEQRRLIVEMEGESRTADAFYARLMETIRSLDPRSGDRSYEPIVATEETTCVVRLGFRIEQLLGEVVCGDLGGVLGCRLDSHGSTLQLQPRSLRIRATYTNPPQAITKGHITLAPKDFVIEMRDKTSPEDQIYFTVSPSSTAVHLDILDEIERLVLAH